MLPKFADFHKFIQNILQLAPTGETPDFILRTEHSLDTITEGGISALIGDDAHAFSGNAGADVGFALENVYKSNRCIAWGNDDNQLLVKVLQLFDRFGSYYYRRLDDNLNKHFAIALDV